MARCQLDPGPCGAGQPRIGQVHQAYGRGIEVSETGLEFNQDTKRISAVEGLRKEIKVNTVAKDIEAYLQGEDKPRNTREVRTVVEGSSTDVGSALKRLVEAGTITVADGPNNSKLYRAKRQAEF